LLQVAAVLATGNAIAAVNGPAAQNFRRLLPETLAAEVQWRRQGDFEGLAGVLASVDDPDLRARLAGEPGPLIPVYLPCEAGGRYPLYRLLVERVVSTNTTAAGGNATLMALGGG
jgi:RHH-type proline utilization regulon transcriptional repressor/proline dehydrogenase/delta 1-pyrroline-5-carboxylate dehydrogenase